MSRIKKCTEKSVNRIFCFVTSLEYLPEKQLNARSIAEIKY